MTKEIDPAIQDRVEIMIEECKELRVLEEEMRDGISNYVEKFKQIKHIRDELINLGISEHELEKIKEGEYD